MYEAAVVGRAIHLQVGRIEQISAAGLHDDVHGFEGVVNLRVQGLGGGQYAVKNKNVSQQKGVYTHHGLVCEN